MRNPLETAGARAHRRAAILLQLTDADVADICAD
jgi:hypothetical protein